MAMPDSGTISFLEMQTEFGGSNPISLSEYYRDGSYVTDNNTSVPTSGAINLADFYSAVLHVLDDITVSGSNHTSAYMSPKGYVAVTYTASAGTYHTTYFRCLLQYDTPGPLPPVLSEGAHQVAFDVTSGQSYTISWEGKVSSNTTPGKGSFFAISGCNITSGDSLVDPGNVWTSFSTTIEATSSTATLRWRQDPSDRPQGDSYYHAFDIRNVSIARA